MVSLTKTSAMLRLPGEVSTASRTDRLDRVRDLGRVSRAEVRMALDVGFDLEEIIWMLELPKDFTLELEVGVPSGTR